MNRRIVVYDSSFHEGIFKKYRAVKKNRPYPVLWWLGLPKVTAPNTVTYLNTFRIIQNIMGQQFAPGYHVFSRSDRGRNRDSTLYRSESARERVSASDSSPGFKTITPERPAGKRGYVRPNSVQLLQQRTQYSQLQDGLQAILTVEHATSSAIDTGKHKQSSQSTVFQRKRPILYTESRRIQDIPVNPKMAGNEYRGIIASRDANPGGSWKMAHAEYRVNAAEGRSKVTGWREPLISTNRLSTAPVSRKTLIVKGLQEIGPGIDQYQNSSYHDLPKPAMGNGGNKTGMRVPRSPASTPELSLIQRVINPDRENIADKPEFRGAQPELRFSRELTPEEFPKPMGERASNTDAIATDTGSSYFKQTPLKYYIRAEERDSAVTGYPNQPVLQNRMPVFKPDELLQQTMIPQTLPADTDIKQRDPVSPALSGKELDRLADRVFKVIEKKIMWEKDRRGH